MRTRNGPSVSVEIFSQCSVEYGATDKGTIAGVNYLWSQAGMKRNVQENFVGVKASKLRS